MSGGETVLVVEDDRSTRMAVVENLKFEGYQVLFAGDGQEGLELALLKRPDLVVLDVMLPRMNGYEVCETLRRHGLMMPVLMLTAKGQEYDRVLGLEIGADDYITKPFSVRELMARVKASLRREKRLQQQTAPIAFGDCVVDLEKRSLARGGRDIPLTRTEFELLRYLVMHPGRVFSRQALLNAAWGFDYVGTDRTVDRFITVLRKKVEPDPSNPRHILTAHGAGYRFER